MREDSQAKPVAKGGGLNRIGGYAVIVAFPIGLLSGFLFLAAARFDPLAFFNPVLLLDGPREAAGLLRWGALTDMLSYYLPFVPFFVAVGARLRRHADSADLVTVGGLMYVTIGAPAAAVLGIAGSELLEVYQTSSGATQEAAAIGFLAVSHAVYYAAWQTVEIIPLGVWAIGSGLLLRRTRPWLGWVGIALGAVCWLSSSLTMLGLTLPMGLWLVPIAAIFALLFWAYALWLSMLLVRNSEL